MFIFTRVTIYVNCETVYPANNPTFDTNSVYVIILLNYEQNIIMYILNIHKY